MIKELQKGNRESSSNSSDDSETERRKKKKGNRRRAKNELVLKIVRSAILRREYCSEANTKQKLV